MSFTGKHLEISTQWVQSGVHGKEKQCAYCGKVIEPDTVWDEYECSTFYHCDCEDAKKEIEIRQQLMKLEKDYKNAERELRDSIPKPKYKSELVWKLTPMEREK